MQAITTRTQDVLKAIQAWPHWHTIQLVAEKEYGVSEAQFEQLLPEYQRFLCLIATGHQHLGMYSKQVDKLWHSHILHTQLYADFCMQHVGRIVHHVPNLAVNAQTICAGKPCETTCKTPPPSCNGELTGGEPSQFFDAYVSAYGEIPGTVWNAPQADGHTL